MAADNGQERTEQATEKRLRESKEKGQIARSRDFNTMIILFGSVLFAMAFGGNIASVMLEVFVDAFTATREEIFDKMFFVKKAYETLQIVSQTMLPFLIAIVMISIFGPILVGGFNFSVESFFIKFDRLDPIKGLKKMVSLKSLVELIKAVMKFSLICVFFVTLVNYKLQDVFSLDQKAVNIAAYEAADTILFTMLIISMPLIIVSLIDVPFQIWDNAKQIKMTKQELKDEMKDTDGKPEVKSKIKALQRELRKRRMMSNVAKADVVITNPTHYAVAIKYDEMQNPAPVVLAKGVNLFAEMIKKVAKANGVAFVSSPELARAIYFNVEIDDEVPSGLYVAVAKILAYVYELRLYNKGNIDKPVLPRDLSIPEEFRTEG